MGLIDDWYCRRLKFFKIYAWDLQLANISVFFFFNFPFRLQFRLKLQAMVTCMHMEACSWPRLPIANFVVFGQACTVHAQRIILPFWSTQIEATRPVHAVDHSCFRDVTFDPDTGRVACTQAKTAIFPQHKARRKHQVRPCGHVKILRNRSALAPFFREVHFARTKANKCDFGQS